MTDADDPIEQEREAARDRSAGSQLPSESGLSPGAGETQGAEVSAPPVPETGDVPANPSLGEPPRHDQGRPQFRTSQLQEGDESGQSSSPPERAGPRH